MYSLFAILASNEQNGGICMGAIIGDGKKYIRDFAVDFTDKEINWMWENGVKYIVKGNKLYEIRFSKNYEPHFYAHKIFTFNEPQTHRGRYWAMTAEEVNTSHAKDGVPTLLTN